MRAKVTQGTLTIFFKNTLIIWGWGKDANVTLTRDGGKETFCFLMITLDAVQKLFKVWVPKDTSPLIWY